MGIHQEIRAASVELDSRYNATNSIDCEQLLRTHSAFINRIARSVFAHMSSSTPLEDLVQIGSIALIQAARDFVDRGTARFTTYAGIRIRGAMIDELRRSATVSRQGGRYRRRFAAARDRLSGVLGRMPTDNEMAESQSMTLAEYSVARSATQGITYESVDAAYSEFNTAYADQRQGAFDQMVALQFKQALASAIAQLPPQQAMVLQLYFAEELDLASIGKLIEVGPARVCQIKKAALDTIRRQMKAWQP